MLGLLRNQGGHLVRTAPGAPILPAMCSADRVEVILELEAPGEGEPIRGQISAPTQHARPFYGWVELAGALEEARRGAAALSAPGIAAGRVGAQEDGMGAL